jgi:aldose 1-epimerase
MYNIRHIQNAQNQLDFIEIENLSKSSFARICLNDGGSLKELNLNYHHVIKDLSPLSYNKTYASSVLFPFANRIKDGRYEFDGTIYQFDINEPDNNNALHGLVYNKPFELIDEKITETYAVVKLVYHEKLKDKGFPFTYSIYLEYILGENSLDFSVEIKNTGIKPFPFTLGWHPYFLSDDLCNSTFIFDSSSKLKLDDRNITEGIVPNDKTVGFKVNDQFLDDCFILESNTVLFSTPSYILTLKSSENECYLQLYTPPHPNTIAIEPTTGVSDSFSNGIGLKTLHPDDTYSIKWNLIIDNC